MNLYGETSDEYSHVVVMLDAKTRVIAADIQWIVQERRGNEWRGVLFFRTKSGMLHYIKPAPPELLALPDSFPEGRQGRVETSYNRRLGKPKVMPTPATPLAPTSLPPPPSTIRPSSGLTIESSLAA